ncbi:MAG: calcium-binding protein [Myxococcales bacterium]|nr:calcium-binding protein [Myxococcales bacterium]
MLARHLVSLALLLPALSLVAVGCDKEGDPVATAGDSETGDDGEGADGDESAGGSTDGDGNGGGGGGGGGGSSKPSAAQLCDAEVTEMECETSEGDAGTTYCIEVEGEEVWTECATAYECTPGDGWDYGCMGEVCVWDGEKLTWDGWSEPECNTPLVVNLDGAPLRFEAAAAPAFDINATGECLSTDWPTLPWLALDRDGDGVIEDGRELFGSGTRLASGERAAHGFAALAELDSDGDGQITAADPAFAELVLWTDGDGDRRGELRELVPLAEVNLVAIDLGYTTRVECDERGNCGRERASFEFRGASGAIERGEIVDVYLPCQ